MCSRAFRNDQHKLTEWTEIAQRDILTLDRWIDSTKIQNVLWATWIILTKTKFGLLTLFLLVTSTFQIELIDLHSLVEPWLPVKLYVFITAGQEWMDELKKKIISGNLTICESDSPTTDSIKQ